MAESRLPGEAPNCSTNQAPQTLPSLSCPTAATTRPGHEGKVEVVEHHSTETRSTTAVLHRNMRELEAVRIHQSACLLITKMKAARQGSAVTPVVFRS